MSFKGQESPQEIIEGNKLIAQFMGYEYFPHIEGKPMNAENGWRKPTSGHLKMQGWYLCRTNKQLKYDQSWDWLMPVIDKIEDYPIRTRVTISTTFVRAHTGGENIEYNCEVVGGKIEAAWMVALEVIKLNAQNK